MLVQDMHRPTTVFLCDHSSQFPLREKACNMLVPHAWLLQWLTASLPPVRSALVGEMRSLV